MKISYCDRCLQPISGKIFYLMIWEYKDDLAVQDSEGNTYNKGLAKTSEQEICEDCKKVIDQVLADRMFKLLHEAEECKHIYNLPAKEPKLKKEKKPKNKK